MNLTSGTYPEGLGGLSNCLQEPQTNPPGRTPCQLNGHYFTQVTENGVDHRNPRVYCTKCGEVKELGA